MHSEQILTIVIGWTRELYKWREGVLMVRIVKISEGVVFWSAEVDDCEFFI